MRFATHRLVRMVATLLVATFVFFAAVTVLPGDPVRGLFGPRPPPPGLHQEISEEFHLDRPFLVQYGLFVTDLLRGDLGHSYPHDPSGAARRGPPIAGILVATLPVSLRLLGATVALQFVAGVAIGTGTAVRRRTRTDVSVYAVAVLLVSVPVIVAAFVLQAFVGFPVPWLPHRWIADAGWTNYVLPTASLAAASAGYVLLLTRAELLANLRRPFVQAAVARGLHPRRVVGVHALRASLVPVVAFATANLGNLVAGLVVVESVFGIPGTGAALFNALQRQERALIVVIMTMTLVAVIVVNTLADVVADLIDPRIGLEGD